MLRQTVRTCESKSDISVGTHLHETRGVTAEGPRRHRDATIVRAGVVPFVSQRPEEPLLVGERFLCSTSMIASQRYQARDEGRLSGRSRGGGFDVRHFGISLGHNLWLDFESRRGQRREIRGRRSGGTTCCRTLKRCRNRLSGRTQFQRRDPFGPAYNKQI